MSHSFGFAGFPLLNGIARGEMFVDFMSRRRSAQSAPTGSASAPPSGLTPGGFDNNATRTELSKDRTVDATGAVNAVSKHAFSDGSSRTMTREKSANGDITVSGVRRSLPDADGMEKVRVWEKVVNPDGTEELFSRVFRVPAGTTMDWDSAAAQRFMLWSRRTSDALALSFPAVDLPDPTLVPDASIDAAEPRPEDNRRTQDEA